MVHVATSSGLASEGLLGQGFFCRAVSDVLAGVVEQLPQASDVLGAELTEFSSKGRLVPCALLERNDLAA
jgi:hypothetical protein